MGTGQRAAEIRVIFPVFQPWFRTDKRVRGRDGCRVPLPWDSNPQDTGFGEHPWLPQPDYWVDLSVTQQELDSRSPLNFYREMIWIRREYDLGVAHSSGVSIRTATSSSKTPLLLLYSTWVTLPQPCQAKRC
ncbi:alpha-amylase family glycosyl hydrolase [Arcanobacterium haemolyticum]|uniref:alpha-amylase family glycosyl hydrolase n=1 Tax=Arcanobacterium haemolyticum TaxID=28264 RepID=UPI00403A080E